MVDQAAPPPAPIRILVTDVLDGVYGKIVAMVSAEPDMQIVGRVTNRVELLLAVDDQIEIIILGAPHRSPPPGICSHLLNEYPDLKILVLADDSDELDVYWRGLRQRQLPLLSDESLVSGIRELHQLDVMM
jgi:hypothetical protein